MTNNYQIVINLLFGDDASEEAVSQVVTGRAALLIINKISLYHLHDHFGFTQKLNNNSCSLN